MFSLIIALAVGVVSALLTGFITGYSHFGVFVGIVLALVTFFLFVRKITAKVRDIFFKANAELQKQKFDRAIAVIKEAERYSRWAFLIKAQINGQIGVILYTQRKFAEAYKYLQDTNPRIFHAYAMLIIGHIKNNKKDEAKKAIDLLLKFNKKEAFAYSLAGYIYETEFADRDEALAILQKGLKSLPHNQNVIDHHLALQNSKRFKMERYGDIWHQMMLEKKGLHKLQQKYIKAQQKRMGIKNVHR